MQTAARAFMAILLSWLAVAGAQASEVTIEDPYVRAVPPGQPVTAAFFVAINQGNAPRAIVGAQTPIAERAEVHEHIHDQGVMRMRAVERVAVPAHGRVAFEPGGYHVMLIGLKRALKPGERVHLSLTLDDGTRIALQPEVRRIQPHGGSGHTQHGMRR